MTEPGHLPGPALGKASYRSDKRPDSETTLDGNAVVLEEQMVKLTDARMDYDAAIGFYQKALGMLKMASGRPGVG
jgi:flagellar basal-body rod protein FlgB